MRDEIRRSQEEKIFAIKNTGKQLSELHQAYKKQLQLVDNLKKQQVPKYNSSSPPGNEMIFNSI